MVRRHNTRVDKSQQHIMSLVQKGRLEEALSMVKKQARAEPHNSDLWLLQGSIYANLNDFKSVIYCCGKVLDLNPQHPAALYNMGVAYQMLGEPGQAECAYRGLLELYPENAPAHNNLASILREQGNLTEAARHGRKSLQIEPNNTAAYNNLGLTLEQSGELDSAIECFKKALELDPEMAAAYLNLGRVLFAMGDIRQSLVQFKKACQFSPDNADAYTEAAHAAEALSRFVEAEEYYGHALTINPEFLAARYRLGLMLSSLGRYKEARSEFDRILQVQPDDSETVAALALSYEHEGRHDKALALLEPVMNHVSVPEVAALTFALLAPRVGRIPEAIGYLQGVLTRSGADNDHASIHFALGKLYDKQKEYDLAFHHYSQANESVQRACDMNKIKNDFDRLIMAFPVAEKRRHARSTNMSSKPVFVVGMPRSGTSLVEQILDSHPAVFGAGELDDIAILVSSIRESQAGLEAYPECMADLSVEILDEYAGRYLAQLERISRGAKRVIDKMPHNFLALGLIDMLFPGAHVIHCVRDPRDTCLSIFFQSMTANHPYTSNLNALADYYREYQRLMAHWKNVVSVPIMDVRYEDLVTNTEVLSKRLVEFCGLEWDARCLEFYTNERVVSTPTYSDVRTPVYTAAVGRWKHYEEHLGPLRSLVNP